MSVPYYEVYKSASRDSLFSTVPTFWGEHWHISKLIQAANITKLRNIYYCIIEPDEHINSQTFDVHSKSQTS